MPSRLSLQWSSAAPMVVARKSFGLAVVRTLLHAQPAPSFAPSYRHSPTYTTPPAHTHTPSEHTVQSLLWVSACGVQVRDSVWVIGGEDSEGHARRDVEARACTPTPDRSGSRGRACDACTSRRADIHARNKQLEGGADDGAAQVVCCCGCDWIEGAHTCAHRHATTGVPQHAASLCPRRCTSWADTMAFALAGASSAVTRTQRRTGVRSASACNAAPELQGRRRMRAGRTGHRRPR